MGMEPLKETLKNKTVNSNNNIDNTYTVNSSILGKKIGALLADYVYSSKEIADQLCDSLGDKRSSSYFLLLAKNIPHIKLLEAASITLDMSKNSQIRTKKSIYFLGILRKWGYKTKFKKNVKK